jgi:hypothetical protein
MRRHEEIPIKVTAWVDRGVAELVVALNGIRNLISIDSCENRRNEGVADVYFVARGLANDTTHLAADLDALLGGQKRLGIWYRISVGGEPDRPVARIEVATADVARLARTVAMRSHVTAMAEDLAI